MLENVFKNTRMSVKITVKTAVSVGLILMSAFLPLLVHAFAGASGGITWLPMYLPVLIGGCLLGSIYGVMVGAISPIASYFISQLILGRAMPASTSLPFMIVELAVFGVISGLFSKGISKNSLLAFPAVLLAQVCGRVVNLLIHAIVIAFGGQGTILGVVSSMQVGLIGLYLQAIIVPLIIMGLAYILNKKKVANDV